MNGTARWSCLELRAQPFIDNEVAVLEPNLRDEENGLASDFDAVAESLKVPMHLRAATDKIGKRWWRG